jgi:O-antigen ligase
MAILVAAAVPVRVTDGFPVVRSISILDIVLVGLGTTLVLDLAFRPVDAGYRSLFRVLFLPLVVATASLAWTQDFSATLRAMLVYAEGVVAYLLVVRELEGLPPARVVGYIKRFAYLLIVPAVLLELHVPGFSPQAPGLKHSAGDYISYYTRLSHPFIGRSNNLATILAFFTPLLFYWGHDRHDRRFTRAAFLTLLAIFLTLSRGTLLAFVIAGVLYVPFLYDRRRAAGRSLARKIFAGVVLGAAAILVFYSLNPTVHEFFGGRFTLTNVNSRFRLVSLSLSKVADRPLLGYGAGVIPDADPQLAPGSHNTYLQQIVYFGLPLGLVVCGVLWRTAGIFLARRRLTPLAGVVAYVLLVQLVAFLFEASFEGTVLRVLFYLSIGLAVGLLRSVEAENVIAAGGP